jgi:iron complex transport system substrate-binding protein
MVRTPGNTPRVVSLLASATEIIAGLEALDLLVARSHECDFPSDVTRLPVVTAPKLDTRRPSATVDRDVKRLLEQALAIYHVDGAMLRELAPDLILTQTQCEVCAVTPADVEAALAEWTGKRPRIVALSPNSLDDVFADVQRVADAIGRTAQGTALAHQMRERMDRVAARTAHVKDRPRVAAIEWLDPLMAGGNWMPDLVAMAGGINLFGEAGRHSPWMTLDDLVRADPDVVLVLPCGFDIARTQIELPALTWNPAWQALRAVRERRIFLCDGNQYFNRPGPRLVESLEILGEIFHPSLFGHAHRSIGWIPLP